MLQHRRTLNKTSAKQCVCFRKEILIFANGVERKSPLAAWIASPDGERPARWKRIADVLPFGWIDLVNVDRMDTIELVQAMLRTDTGWKQQAVRQVVNDCDADSSLLVDLVPLLNVEGTKAMAAHVLLLLSRTYRPELESILPKAATIWLDAPYDEEQILNVLFGTVREQRSMMNCFSVSSEVLLCIHGVHCCEYGRE